MTGGPLPIMTSMNRPYWDGTALGELRMRKCDACGALFRFVSEQCPKCWSTDLSWQIASGRGKVVAFTTVYRAPYESVEARVPYTIALIDLCEGLTMMSNVIECDPSAVRVGMPVELIFEQRGEVRLPQFRPAVVESGEK